MRITLALLASLSAGGALALEIDAAPVTTGAIMQVAKVMALAPEGTASFAGAPILTDAQISGLVMSLPANVAASAGPPVMETAKASVN
jgi:hypothetical protein